MNITEVIKVVNEMEAEGVIGRYAIGGAVAAAFYLDPASTLDVDIFVDFRADPGSLLISPRSVFDYLKARGCTAEGEYIIIAGWPVQFLPPAGPLGEEALAEAVAFDVEGSSARVFTVEHLAAIALQTGRTKDRVRIIEMVEAGVLDMAVFQAILARHGLHEAWQRFKRQFLDGAP